jgi:hypothetical protein
LHGRIPQGLKPSGGVGCGMLDFRKEQNLTERYLCYLRQYGEQQILSVAVSQGLARQRADVPARTLH